MALEFFDRTEYDNSNLDLYVDHRFREPIAFWLQSIGYKFSPCHPIGAQTLEMALEHTPATIHDGSYLKGIYTLEFSKGNRHPRVQLITTNASPLEIVLRFHSSECIRSAIEGANWITGLFSLRHEPDHTQQGLLYLPSSNVQRSVLIDL